MPRVKLILSVIALTLGLASYYALANYSAYHSAATTLMSNARALQTNWQELTTRLNLDPAVTEPGALAPVLARKHSALDWLVYGEHVMNEDYKEEFQALGIEPLMKNMHVTAPDGKLHYGVAGARLNSMTVLADGTTAVFYSETYRPHIEALLALYDPKPFKAIGDDTGIVRYGKVGEHEYAVGIYLPPAANP